MNTESLLRACTSPVGPPKNHQSTQEDELRRSVKRESKTGTSRHAYGNFQTCDFCSLCGNFFLIIFSLVGKMWIGYSPSAPSVCAPWPKSIILSVIDTRILCRLHSNRLWPRQAHRGGRWGVTDPHSLHDSTLWNFFVHIVEKAVLTNCYYRNNNRPGRLFPQCGIFHNVKKSQGPPNPFKTWCPRLIMWNFPLCERFHNVSDFL